jgi:hypothetical protein
MAKKNHQTMYNAYMNQKFGAANSMCMDLRYEFDGHMKEYYAMMSERCQDYIKNPPGADWDCVFRTTTK